MLACFMSLVCVRRRQVRRCSLPRPPPLIFCVLLTACFSRTRDGSGWVGTDGVVWTCMHDAALATSEAPLCSFLAYPA